VYDSLPCHREVSCVAAHHCCWNMAVVGAQPAAPGRTPARPDWNHPTQHTLASPATRGQGRRVLHRSSRAMVRPGAAGCAPTTGGVHAPGRGVEQFQKDGGKPRRGIRPAGTIRPGYTSARRHPACASAVRSARTADSLRAERGRWLQPHFQMSHGGRRDQHAAHSSRHAARCSTATMSTDSATSAAHWRSPGNWVANCPARHYWR
jgi:hypothetical protein